MTAVHMPAAGLRTAACPAWCVTGHTEHAGRGWLGHVSAPQVITPWGAADPYRLGVAWQVDEDRRGPVGPDLTGYLTFVMDTDDDGWNVSRHTCPLPAAKARELARLLLAAADEIEAETQKLTNETRTP